MRGRCACLLAAGALLAGCAAPSSASQPLCYLGQAQFAHGELFADTVIGGLSGISYNPADQQYYVISDDKGEHGPIRFYTVDVAMNERPDLGIHEVRITDVRTLAGPTAGVDAEGIAVDPQRERIYWSSEGGRPGKDDEVVDPQPWIRIAAMDGRDLGEFLLPYNFVVSPTTGFGIRPNNGLEGLSLAPEGTVLFAGLEEPLFGDDPDLTRITAFDVDSAKPVAQYAYRLDPSPPDQINGLSDLVALSETSMLVIERAGGVRPTIRLYRAEIDDATNTLDLPAVTSQVQPMRKTLVADLSARGGPVPLDNIEGITLGPELSTGHRAVLLVSDDNFNPAQVTQFVMLQIDRKSVV